MEFSKPLYKLLEKVSLGKPNVVGSASDHQLLYVADYDMMETIKISKSAISSFQKKIKKIAHQIADIKIGSIDDWNLLKSNTYSQKNEIAHLNKLWNDQIITDSEYNHIRSLLKPRLSKIDFLKTRKKARFGILRWTPREVKQGYKYLRDKTSITLEDACMSPGITKVDVVMWFRNKYVEISNIVLWSDSNWRPYAKLDDYKTSVYQAILTYEHEGNYMKVAKRMLLLSRKLHFTDDTAKILDILNGPLGRVYMIKSNLDTLKEFPDLIDPKNKKDELDFLIDYYNHLYFNEFQGLPSLDKIPMMDEVLQKNMKLLLKKAKLLPIPKRYRV
jgi:hypothetical protein